MEHPEAMGSHLERYAQVFNAVKINSPLHRPSTYERWAASVPATFRFAVKVPKAITHESLVGDPSEAALLGHGQEG